MPGISFFNLHRVIQTTMGWTNSHLHEFVMGDMILAPAEFEIEYAEHSDKKKLNNFLFEPGHQMKYNYDFGDGWEHDIELEFILTEPKEEQVPRCIGGKRNCPPEDCGGVYGYQELLRIIADKKDHEYKEMMKWLGGRFDPEKFDVNTVNKLLKRKDFGCEWIH